MIVALVLFSTFSINEPNLKLIYVGDPMCSWCYGISEELSEVEKEFKGKVNFELVMGGLRPYNTQTMSELKDFLSHHWKDVYKASKQPFNYDVLDTSITYDTEPPCRANVVVRELAPEQSFAFFKACQRAFYFENKNMHLSESYHDILKELKIDVEQFDKLFASEEMKNLVRKDFERSAEWGVQGFPTLILQQGDNLTLITNGYTDSETMIKRIEAALK